MVLKRLGAASLTLLVAFGVQVAHGVPAHAVASLRAVSCCATHCEHPRSARDARDCCGVRSDTDETATLGAAPTLRAPAVSSTLLAPPALVPVAVTLQIAPTFAPHARGAPLFLLTHSFRV